MKRQGLTGSLEEIPTNSSSLDKISRRQHERHTIQNTPHAQVFSLQNLQLNDSRRKNKIPPTIPEVESTSSDVRINIEQPNSVRGSQSSTKSGRLRTGSTSTNKSRKESSTNSGNKFKRESAPGGFDNKGYEGSMDNVSLGSTRSFERSRTGSNRTTTSVQSLEVHKEQYCCFNKWSPCERRLAALVAILVSVIVILVIVVGVLATNDQGVANALNLSL